MPAGERTRVQGAKMTAEMVKGRSIGAEGGGGKEGKGREDGIHTSVLKVQGANLEGLEEFRVAVGGDLSRRGHFGSFFFFSRRRR